MAVSWGVVVPVKRLALAKTRLASYRDDLRQALALAFAADVVDAALGCALVARLWSSPTTRGRPRCWLPSVR